MKKALALLALTLLALPSSALSLQRIVPLYQIGDGAIQTNDGRIVANPMTDGGYGYVYAAGISSQVPTNCTIKGIVPSGQKISSWWVYPQDPRYRASEGMKISGSDYRGTVIYDDTNYDLSNATVEQYLRYLVARGIDLGTDYIGEYIYNGTHYNDGYCSGESLIQAYIRKYHAFNVFAVRDRLLERGIKLSVLDALAGFGWTYASAYPNVIYAVLKSDYIRYSLTFNPAGGTGDMATLQGNVYTNGFALPPNSFGRTGYTFVGWTNSVGTAFADGASVSGAALGVLTDGETATLSAKWAANVYTVKFDAKGGSVSPTSANATYGAAYGELPTPVRTGYKFAGWYNAGNAITATTVCQKTGAHTLFAKWTANAYTVKFNAKGGNVSPTSQRVTYGGTYGTLPRPVREGYAFAGWYNAGDEITATTVCRKTGAHTLFAKWTVNTYTVAFGANGGSGAMDRQTFTYGRAQALAANAFARAGYTFGGWATTTSGTAVYANKAVVSNLTATAGGVCALYATWTANTYKVYFNANDGSVSPATQHVTYDAAYGTLPTPVREGYVFAGWYNAGNVMTATTICRKTGAHTLFAKWTANAYTVKFDANGGSVSPASQRVAYGGTYGTLPTPTRTGYTFAGWYNAGNVITATTICQKAGAHKLFAKWTANAYTVAFDGNGGTGAMPPQALVYDAPAKLAANAFARAGYAFAGWNRSVNGSGAAYADGAVVSNLTTVANGTVPLYAQWTANAYTVKFDANGGATPTASKQVTYGGTYGTLPTPTRPGYAFAGWYNAGNVITATTICQKAGSHKLFAKWAANAYTVRFARNGGAGEMPPQELVYDAPTNLAANAFTRTGYAFAGWNRSANGSGAAYVDEAVVSNLTTAANGTVPLYAQWTANGYAVTLDPQGGAGGTGRTNVTYAASLPSIAVPTRTGYTFQGYYDTSAASGGTQYYTAAGAGARTWDKAEDTTLYARWTAHTYTVMYALNGGSHGETHPTTATYGSAFSVSAPTRTGYTFQGWTVTSGLDTSTAKWGTSAFPSTTIANSSTKCVNEATGNVFFLNITSTSGGSVTLTANWTANTYRVKFHANGGDGEMAEQSFTYGAAQALMANGFTRMGYSFQGWATSQTGSAVYGDGETVSNLTSQNGDVVTLYAVWSLVYYSLSTSVSGTGSGTVTLSPSGGSYTNGAVVVVTATPATGSSFTRWSDGVTDNPRTYTMTNSVSIAAVFTALTFTVTFEDEDGTVLLNEECNYGAAMPYPGTNPTRTGYRFLGWTPTPPETVTQTAVYTALYEAKSYTVRFHSNYGEGAVARIKEQKFTYGTPQNLSSVSALGFAKTGYTFSGWKIQTGDQIYEDGGQVLNLAESGVVDLDAQWTPNAYTVTFDANGGTGEMADMDLVYDVETNLTANGFSKTGCAFSGWATSANGPAKYADGAAVSNLTATANGTYPLYAKWTANTYTVSLDPQGGTGGTGSTNVTYASALPRIDVPARTGYTFGGYYAEPNGSGVQYYTQSGMSAQTWDIGNDATIYAKWTAHTYQVSFGGNGHNSGSMSNQAFTYDVAQSLATNCFVKTGYSFGGWATNSSSAVMYADKAVVSNLTATAGGWVYLSAKWEANVYAVTFDANGGSVSPTSTSVTYDATYGALPTPTWIGHTFGGWYTSDAGGLQVTAETAVSITAEQTLYAHWTTNHFTVSFDANGGAGGPMDDQPFTYDVAQNLASNSFEKTGYTFGGWATAPDSASAYSDGQLVSNLTATANGVVPLYARWTPIAYAIAFDSNGATATNGVMEVMCLEGAVTTNLTENLFEKTGYTFDGWATNEVDAAALTISYTNCAEVVSTDLSAPLSETNVFYAVWQTNTYTVVFFNVNGGTGEMKNQEFVYDQAQNLAECAFDLNGGNFLGWATNQTGDVVFTNKAEVSNLTAEDNGEVRLYAVWYCGELSKAMHCYNLWWEQHGSGDGQWGAVEGEGEGYNSSGSSLTNAVVAYLITQSYTLKPAESSKGSGNLSFWYKMSASGGCTLDFQADTTNESLVASKDWQKFGPVHVDDIKSVAIKFVRKSQVTRTVWIDQMKWEPASVEPTEKDTPTISSFSAKSTGGFLLSIAASSPTFVYTVLTNATLTADESEWGVYKSVDGTGEPMDFDLATEADAPGVFYKVRVDSK